MTVDTEAPLLPALDQCGGFSAATVDVRAERLLRIQGYHDLARVRPRVRAAAEFAASLAMELAVGEVGFRRLPVTRLGDGVLELAGRHAFHCEAFERYLSGCSSARPASGSSIRRRSMA